LVRLKRAFDREKFATKFKVKKVSHKLKDGDHGRTTPSKDGILTVISSYNEDPKDRMSQWKEVEMLNIVGVHEAGHLVLKWTSAETDSCGCFYCPCHERIIFRELVARFEYSLVHPDASTSKVGWIDNYKSYFANAKQIRANRPYSELCQEMEAVLSQDPTDIDTQKLSDIAGRADKYEKAYKDAQKGPTDAMAGQAIALEAYKAALSDLEASDDWFVRNGICTDLDPYKQVLKNMGYYRADTAFLFIR
jgi:hypothetical protein